MLACNSFHNSDDDLNGWITLVEYGPPEDSFKQLRHNPELPNARHPLDWPRREHIFAMLAFAEGK